MLTVKDTFIFGSNASLPLLTKHRRSLQVALAIKRDSSANSRTHKEPKFQLKVSNRILAVSAIAVFSLGFLDAGYSGDWSRIGVISKENEDLLKAAAFAVVPFCFFLIFSLTTKSED